MYGMSNMYYVVIGSNGHPSCGTSHLPTAQFHVDADNGARLLTMDSEIDTESEFTHNGETFTPNPIIEPQ
jgi:hypothetical protein